ncbi:MAG: type II toxin-antitoxin system VapC family toxin [Bacillota bacterium]
MPLLFSIGITIVTPTLPLLAKAVEFARNFQVSSYDAVYLALADELEFEFITADEKFFNKVRERAGLRATVKLLAET